ncbi:fasciclin domain-containing protein, partial [Longimonas sp.]|uniref:fasciclin domain-containing protein n=1 Tax=Longimonas sp. TaxID=2039626 RepID=UPI003976A48F
MFSLTACDDNGGGMDDDDDDNGDDPTLLSDILGDRDDLSILLEEASGEFDLAEDPDARITIFAPSNDAFADINRDAIENSDNPALLSQVVSYHVLPEIVTAGDLSEGTVQTAFSGNDEEIPGEIRITTDENGDFLINGNNITTADLEAD